MEQAAAILRGGGLVALPTETVYGLGANALDRAAVERIFVAKRRPAWDPIIVHGSDAEMLCGLAAEIPDSARLLMKAFWPGPLTLLLPRTAAVPDAVTAGRPLVGVRMPAHAIALEVIRRAGVPIAAPSANLFGHISPTTAAHVLDDLDGRIDAVLDAGTTAHGVESTVLDPNRSPMQIYRPGAVTLEQIAAIAGPVELYHGPAKLLETPAEALPSPGVGLRHYAPRARLVLVDGPHGELESLLAEAARALTHERVGVMLRLSLARRRRWPRHGYLRGDAGPRPRRLAHRLYAGLRALDDLDCTVILCPLPPAEGIGAAVRDRLLKAGTKGLGRRGRMQSRWRIEAL